MSLRKCIKRIPYDLTLLFTAKVPDLPKSWLTDMTFLSDGSISSHRSSKKKWSAPLPITIAGKVTCIKKKGKWNLGSVKPCQSKKKLVLPEMFPENLTHCIYLFSSSLLFGNEII